MMTNQLCVFVIIDDDNNNDNDGEWWFRWNGTNTIYFFLLNFNKMKIKDENLSSGPFIFSIYKLNVVDEEE